MTLNLGRHIQTRTGDLYDVKDNLNSLYSITYYKTDAFLSQTQI